MSEPPAISCVLCFFNEEDWIGPTIQSLAAQRDRRFELILVDNASTDESVRIARDAVSAMPDIPVRFLEEPRPGKVEALRTGIAAVSAPWFATMDADTIYPADYIERSLQLAARNDSVCAMAFGSAGRSIFGYVRSAIYGSVFRSKCHSGGFGQIFRKDIFDKVGGFDPDRWPYVLEDHEIVHQMQKHGRIGYDPAHVCYPSDRRSDRSDCSWTLMERVLYKALPRPFMDWFFYRFLAKRFEKRGLVNLRLRRKNWAGDSAES